MLEQIIEIALGVALGVNIFFIELVLIERGNTRRLIGRDKKNRDE